MSFKEKVLEVVRNIPEGETRTYKEVAELAGSKNAYRSVGSIMKKNYDPTVPCHRVVKSDGTVGDYNRGGETIKKIILGFEKANIVAVKIINESDLSEEKKQELLNLKPKW